MNAVRIDSVLWSTICGSSSRSSSSLSIGRADQAAALAHHEGDDLGGGLLGGDDEVALVLPVLVVDDDDGASGRDVADGLLDGVEGEVLDDAVGSGCNQVGWAVMPWLLPEPGCRA